MRLNREAQDKWYKKTVAEEAEGREFDRTDRRWEKGRKDVKISRRRQGRELGGEREGWLWFVARSEVKHFTVKHKLAEQRWNNYSYPSFSAEMKFLLCSSHPSHYFFLPSHSSSSPSLALLRHHPSCCRQPPAYSKLAYKLQRTSPDRARTGSGALKMQMSFLLTKLAVGCPPLQTCCKWRRLNYSYHHLA